jgi:hypothetical protein
MGATALHLGLFEQPAAKLVLRFPEPEFRKQEAM